MHNNITLLHFLFIMFLCVCCHEKQQNVSRRYEIGTKDWDNAIQLFRETVIRNFLQDGRMIVINGGTATSWLLSIIQNKAQEGDTVWDKLEAKINERVSERLDDSNLKYVRAFFIKIMQLMEKSAHNLYTKYDLEVIKSISSNFFPQAYPDVSFTVKWLNGLSKYLTILAAGYLDLMKTGDMDDCKLAEQLNMFRPLILDAAKKLAMSRYRALKQVRWSGGYNKFGSTASLTFLDEASGIMFQDIPLSQLTGRVFTPLKQETADVIMKHFVNNFNALYNETWRGESCTVEPLLTIQELEIEYPDQCMDAEGICMFPCGHYMEPKTWCVTKVKGNRWDIHGVRSWQQCTTPNWDNCMFIKELQPSKWPNEERTRIYDSILAIPIQSTDNNNTKPNLMYDGNSAVRTIFDDGNILLEDEKQLLNKEIANKVKIFMLQKGKNSNVTDNIKPERFEEEKKELFDAFLLKALDAKKKYGNIKKYLADIQNAAVFVLA